MSGGYPSDFRPSADGPPVSDIAWCHEAVQDVSRTFAITIDVLDEPMSSYICVGYLLCRIADTIEDARDIPPADQSSLLQQYEQLLDPEGSVTIEEFMTAIDPWIPQDRTDDWCVVSEAPRVIRAFESQPPSVRAAILPPVRKLVTGMIIFVDRYAQTGGLRIQTAEELEEYCYYAAGTVGELITNIICRHGVPESTRSRLHSTATSFGLLLQLVNISKDVYVDFTVENNVYLPANWLRDEGVSVEGISAGEHPERMANVITRTADHARTYLDDAQTYLETVPERDGNRLAAWAIPFLLAVGTLRELSDRPEDAISEEGIKITRREVHAIVGTTLEDVERASIGQFRTLISQRPYTGTDSIGPTEG